MLAARLSVPVETVPVLLAAVGCCWMLLAAVAAVAAGPQCSAPWFTPRTRHRLDTALQTLSRYICV